MDIVRPYHPRARIVLRLLLAAAIATGAPGVAANEGLGDEKLRLSGMFRMVRLLSAPTTGETGARPHHRAFDVRSASPARSAADPRETQRIVMPRRKAVLTVGRP
ncbi:MAG: hypothetical protein RLW61_04775 [Gammaproteobacteria bacterium]